MDSYWYYNIIWCKSFLLAYRGIFAAAIWVAGWKAICPLLTRHGPLSPRFVCTPNSRWAGFVCTDEGPAVPSSNSFRHTRRLAIYWGVVSTFKPCSANRFKDARNNNFRVASTAWQMWRANDLHVQLGRKAFHAAQIPASDPPQIGYRIQNFYHNISQLGIWEKTLHASHVLHWKTKNGG